MTHFFKKIFLFFGIPKFLKLIQIDFILFLLGE